MISTLAIAGYRSLRDIRVKLGRLTVVTGANGTGKSSLYRALRLLAEVAQGRVVQALAAEGGLSSVLWAGVERPSLAMKRGEAPVQGGPRAGPVALKLGFSGPDYGFAIDLGLPIPSQSVFGRDPAIKAESAWTGEKLGRANVFAERRGGFVRVRDLTGSWVPVLNELSHFDSMMTHCGDPQNALELLVLRERMRAWRFYDHIRTDAEAPARRPHVGVFTPVLAASGADLPAAVETIREVGDKDGFDAAIADAFEGAAVEIAVRDGYFSLSMRQKGLLRPLGAEELSEGTLRFLLLSAALLSPRPPELMILNEPETSLHPTLIPALARLITAASAQSQIIVVTHDAPLAEALLAEAGADAVAITLTKELGATNATGAETPPWSWPAR